MELILKRTDKTEESTIGELFIYSDFECYILEDKDRGLTQSTPLEEIKKLKQYGKTAIPSGMYEIAITFSNRFQKYLPLLMAVPGFGGIRIHSGNKATDSSGCLLTGKFKGVNQVLQSRLAFNQLFVKLKAVGKKEKIFITIE